LFEKFYSEIVPEGEMEPFLATLREDLPVVFRTISGSNFSSFVHKDIASHFPNGEGVEVNGKMVDAPYRLKYMPSVYQFNISRKDTRSEPKLAQFKKWLVGAAEAGQVVRQEAVSMIPTSLLDVHDGHMVLDMCAAPGSKTTQLLEGIHENGEMSSGVVVANELNENRARMLTHRLKSVTGSNLIITNHDARMFPRIHVGIDPETTGGGTPLDFDRVLCDVPCTGDGTMRKAADLWNRWSPDMAKGLHVMQLLIAQRGAHLLKEGGRLVYSTCSMNPMEDEAIVAEMLRSSQGALTLVDCSEYLPLFRRLKGVSDWKVMNKNGDYIDQAHEEAKFYAKSVWPPTKEEAEKFNLDRCWRILPHHQNTGGFFCAVFEKVGPLPRAAKKTKVAKETAEEPAAVAEAATTNNDNNNNNNGGDLMEIEENVDAAGTAPVVEKGKEEAAAAGGEPPKNQKKKRVRRSYESPYIMVDPESENGATVRQGLEYFGLDLDPTKFMVRNDESVG
jgi:16S rRNA C967 or C1407 C5-methylase (RsmB/RsmF family)